MVLEKVEQIQAKKKVEDKNEAGLIFNVEVKERQELKMAARFSWAPDPQTMWNCPQKRGVVIKEQVSRGEGGIELAMPGNSRK